MVNFSNATSASNRPLGQRLAQQRTRKVSLHTGDKIDFDSTVDYVAATGDGVDSVDFVADTGDVSSPMCTVYEAQQRLAQETQPVVWCVMSEKCLKLKVFAKIDFIAFWLP